MFSFTKLIATKINMKGVVERSSVFASEIFTAISPIAEINHVKCYIGLNLSAFLSKDKKIKKNNLEVFKQAYKFCVL